MARGEAERVWADDEKLDRMVTLPWATLPGRIALDAGELQVGVVLGVLGAPVFIALVRYRNLAEL